MTSRNPAAEWADQLGLADAPLFSEAQALLNSRAFDLLLAEYCPHMAGGQYNLSKRYISSVPIPNLAQTPITSPSGAGVLSALSKFGEAISDGIPISEDELDAAVAESYGVEPRDWPRVAR